MPIKNLKSLSAFLPFNLLLQKYGEFNPNIIYRIKHALEYIFLKLVNDPKADSKYQQLIFTSDKANVDEVINQIKREKIELPADIHEELQNAYQRTVETLSSLESILKRMDHNFVIYSEFSHGELSVSETLSGSALVG